MESTATQGARKVTKHQIAQALALSHQGMSTERAYRWYMTMLKSELVEFADRRGVEVPA